MKNVLFSTEELEHLVETVGEVPPIGTQWWEMPADKVPAIVINNGNGISHLALFDNEAEFSDRPAGVSFIMLHSGLNLKPQSIPRVWQKRKKAIKTSSWKERAFCVCV